MTAFATFIGAQNVAAFNYAWQLLMLPHGVLALSISGQLGDLTESAVKRRFRIKDSGDIIPGHGGLMDRLDSVTFPAFLLVVVGVLHSGWGDIASGVLHW